MIDWIGLGVILLLLVGGIYALVRANEPRTPLTEEEFEMRAHESRGLMGAGVMALQKLLDPAVEKAAAVQEDFRQGYLDGEQESGEGAGDDDIVDQPASQDEFHSSNVEKETKKNA